MRPLCGVPDDFEIKARASCRSCGKTRELSGEELHGAASVDAFKELESRLRCTNCGERSVSVQPIWHRDWAGRMEN
jgi:rubredoxin